MFNKFKRIIKKRKNYQPSLEPPKSNLPKEVILKKIKKIPFWWHYIELGYGIVTPGHKCGENNPQERNGLDDLKMPSSFEGKSVLDIGAWDGFFGFEAEKRGATKILAIDNFYRLEREGKHLEAGNLGFEIAKEILDSKAEAKEMDVLEISPEKIGTFDIVLALGLLYHVKHPLLALEKIAAVTKEMLILETHYENKYNKKPAMFFYKDSKLNQDPTNWWGFNKTCLKEMLLKVGFKRVECVFRNENRIVIHVFK